MKVESYWSHTFLPELIRPDGVIFDFGTNNGGFCKLVAPLCQRVMGFEPDPYWDRRLLLPDNVFVFRKALAAKRGTVRLNLNQGKCSSMHYLDTGARPVDVDAITLADAVALAPAERIELEPVSKSFEENNEAGKLDKAEEIAGVVLPANEDPALPLNPGEEAFDEPASHVAA